MKSKFKFLMIVAAMGLSISACKKDKPLPDVNEQELITTLSLKFTNMANPSDVKTFTSKDLDGDGGNPPQNQPIILAANTTYNLEVSQLLNETKNPAENILEEVKKESDEHLFVYKPSPTDLMNITITDKDVNNLPIGILGRAATGEARAGTLTVILRHQPPMANGTRVKNGTEAPGATDTERLFTVTIQ